VDDASFIRYLSAKATVDDRALNRRAWDAMTTRVGPAPRVLELGGGIGTMIVRAAADRALRPGSWTLVDGKDALVREAGRRLAGMREFPVELLCADVEDYVGPGLEPFDLVIANAFLDLFDPAQILPKLLRLVRPSGTFLFSITFDGLTALEPEVDRELDQRIAALYHRTMDERTVAGRIRGDSRAGRHLLTLLPRSGYHVVEAGSSDWIVYPRDGDYPADERFFLSCILGFFEESLSARAESGRGELDRSELRRWLDARRSQLDAGELVLVAHQLDVCAAPAGEEAPSAGN
jgi:SAM-dependent methyltransferase